MELVHSAAARRRPHHGSHATRAIDRAAVGIARIRGRLGNMHALSVDLCPVNAGFQEWLPNIVQLRKREIAFLETVHVERKKKKKQDTGAGTATSAKESYFVSNYYVADTLFGSAPLVY